MPNYGIPTGPWTEGQTGHFAWSTAIAAAVNQIGGFLDAPLDNISAWASFTARVAQRESGPIVVVFCGSSTTYNATQAESDRYVAKFAAQLQTRYPSTVSPAVKTLAQAVTTPPSGPGIHVVNAGISGSRSGDQVGATGAGTPYLTATTRAQIVALNPVEIVHMIGSNDLAHGIASSVYKANELAHIDDFTARGYNFGHTFIHSYERYDDASIAARVEPWVNYLTALREIVVSRRNTSVIDVSRDFGTIGIPSADPMGYMNADKIHMLAAGHTFMASLLERKILGGTSATASTPPVGPTDPTRTIYTSDTWSGGNRTTFSGRSTDAGAGGTPVAYQSTAFGSWGITSSALARTSSGTEYLAIPVPSGDFDIDLVQGALSSHSGTTLNSIDFRRQAMPTGSDGIRLRTRSDGSMTLSQIIGGTETELPAGTTATGVLTVGATLRIRAYGNQVTISVNGTPVLTGTVSITAAGFIGFTKSSTITAISYASPFQVYTLAA